MTNRNKQRTTFWKFLKTNNVEIPIIQRDYAQGRVGKEKLREKFLKDLKNALDTEKILKLDFVYGSVERNKINPLDGQQRLTTLWLLHWFIAYKSGILEKGIENEKVVSNIFKKFSYETRVSSREFCEKLSEFSDPQPKKIGEDGNEILMPVIEHIQNQTWFFLAWKQDPTIQAMLNMLGGTPIKGKDNNEIIDGIEELFDGEAKCSLEEYQKYWKILISDACPIVFYYMPLNELKLSDDLYIKMNARGKSLTNFENFKADLVDYIKENEWEKNVLPQDTIAHKLDTDWTNIFWKNKSNEHNIDDIYFAFFNRYFLNALVTAKKTDSPTEYQFTIEKIYIDQNNQHKTFKHLFRDTIDYTGIDIYFPKIKNKEGKEINLFNENTLTSFLNVLNNISSLEDVNIINKALYPFGETEFRFIPDYEDEKLRPFKNMQSRVVFHAIFCYFEKNNYDKIKFAQWLRVVWNLIENINFDNASMIGAMRLIDDLGRYSNDIYTHLKSRIINDRDFASEQMKEEKEKAGKILENIDYRDSDGKSWEEKMIDAEKTAFFKGAIRFLFRINVDVYDWTKFDDRLKKAEKYFDETYKANFYKGIDAIVLRFFISFFEDWKQFWNGFNYYKPDWKSLLTSKEWLVPSGKILDIDINSFLPATFSSILPDTTHKLVHEDLVKDKLLALLKDHNKGYFLKHYWNWDKNRYWLYPNHGGNSDHSQKYNIGDKRNEILSKLIDDGIITSKQKIPDIPFFWGADIEFECISKSFKWIIDWGQPGYLSEKNLAGDYEEIKDETRNKITIDTLDNYLRNIYMSFIC